MLSLNLDSIKNRSEWSNAGIETPNFDYDAVSAKTRENPEWVHFGAGNIFRGFPAALQQKLLNEGKADTGIIAVEAYDFEIIEKIYKPYDNLSMLVIMKPDGSLENKVIGSITEALVGDPSHADEWERLKTIFTKPSLKMASFTITEKGYSIRGMLGDYSPIVMQDFKNGPENPVSIMGKITALTYIRYKHNQLPIALVSMDNCSHNGEKLYNSVNEIAGKWAENGQVEKGFLDYINNPAKVSFPWSMIDKITPRPSDTVKESLEKIGFKDSTIITTTKNTYIATFVNAEGPQYLVIEDHFPNGRMPLELAGVYFTDRETVDRVERMKVCTCLNPLHTSLAVYGCLLGYNLIADEMKDPQLKKLVEKVGYDEGMPVVVNPGIIEPSAFIKEVLEVRFPNPYNPDTPQRIAMDTSQKVGIRFGETIKSYCNMAGLDPKTLKFIPLVIAGWCRYMMGIDDNGNEMALSPDPMLDMLKSYISGVKLGDARTVGDSLRPILSNKQIFGSDLYEVGLGEKIEGFYKELVAGKNAVRNTLVKYLG